MSTVKLDIRQERKISEMKSAKTTHPATRTPKPLQNFVHLFSFLPIPENTPGKQVIHPWGKDATIFLPFLFPFHKEVTSFMPPCMAV